MIIIDDIEQGSEQWIAARLGIASSSCFSKIVTSKGEPSASAKDYMYELAEQRITGKIKDKFYSQDMQEGHDREEDSRNLFAMVKGLEVRQVGLIYMDELRDVLCSPDGLIVGEEAGFEVKNPKLKTHDKTLTEAKMPTKHIHQVQGSMMVTGYSHWWFASCFPGVKPFITKVARDEIFIGKLRSALTQFNAELNLMVRKLEA